MPDRSAHLLGSLFTVQAATKSEARAAAKVHLHIPKNGRLPAGTIVERIGDKPPVRQKVTRELTRHARRPLAQLSVGGFRGTTKGTYSTPDKIPKPPVIDREYLRETFTK